MRYKEIYGPSWIDTLPTKMFNDLLEGRSIILGGKIYCVCSDCLTVVQTNKTFFGSLHVCS
jgi:hypothetical protein